jgi:hypothetical protein
MLPPFGILPGNSEKPLAFYRERGTGDSSIGKRALSDMPGFDAAL